MQRGWVQQGGRFFFSVSLFPALLAVLFCVGMCAAHFVALPVSDAILPWQRELYPTANTLPGKLVYAALMACLAVGALWRLVTPCCRHRGASWSWMLPFCVVVAFTVGSPVSLPFALGFWSTLTAWLYLGRDRRFPESVFEALGRLFVRPLARAVVFLFVTFCIALPLITPVVASCGAQLVSLNNHYSGFMPGFDLALGARGSPIGVLNYGWGPALLVGGFYRLFSPLASDLVRLALPIKCYQFVALALLAVALRTLTRRHWFPLFALALASTPTFSNVSDAIYYPNLSGIRYLSILAMILLLARASSPGVLGIASALSLLYASETGIVASIGAATWLVVTWYRPSGGLMSLGRPLLRYILGLCAFVPAYLVVRSLRAGSAKSPTSSFVMDFVSGFCGISDLPTPFAIVIFFFASFAVYQGFSRAGCGRARTIDAYQAAVGSMMLVWLFYYINRMHTYNLWFQSALLILLVAPRCDVSVVRLLRRGSLFARSSILVLTALFVALSADHMAASVRDVREWYYRVRAVYRLSGSVTDLSVPEPLHSEVVARVNVIQGLSPKADYLVVSNLSTDVRVLGFNQGLPWYDLFSDVLTTATLDRARTWIDLYGPRFILVDDPSGGVARDAVAQTAQLHGVVRGLPSYQEVSARDGWITFERRDK